MVQQYHSRYNLGQGVAECVQLESQDHQALQVRQDKVDLKVFMVRLLLDLQNLRLQDYQDHKEFQVHML